MSVEMFPMKGGYALLTSLSKNTRYNLLIFHENSILPAKKQLNLTEVHSF